MSELKACPFCECRTIYEYSNGQCVCNRCGAARNTKKQWNRRPAEDALQKRVDELTEENAILEAGADVLHKNTLEILAELKAAEKRVGELTEENNLLRKDIGRLTEFFSVHEVGRKYGVPGDNSVSVAIRTTIALDKRVGELEEELSRTRRALEWYEYEVGNCNKTSFQGDTSRDRLARDQGKRATEALAKEDGDE